MLRILSLAALLLLTSLARGADPARTDPLPSWNDTAPKKAILAFVEKVTKEGSADFVKPEERIATFDNDGTLWCEQPLYVQGIFALDRVKELAPQHPDWKEKAPFKYILEGNIREALAGGDHALLELIAATHTGMSVADFEKIVTDWLATARHPRFKQPYTQCIYVPMVELAAYLRANGFKTYIVSGGGVEFMRPWTEKAYGIPPSQVVGSRGKTKYELRESGPVLMKLPEVAFIDDGPGKPVGINDQIGRRPLMAFGNSDGDIQMLEWATVNKNPGFALFVHHTDKEREYAYDRDSHIGKLDKGLDEAPKRGWTVVDMKSDWKRIFPFDSAEPMK